MEDNKFYYSFEKLDVWHESRKLLLFVYKITKSFPNDEKYGLINQMRRAAVSVPSNIAEGTSRYSKKDFARYIQISYGSLMEVLNQAYIARDLQYITYDILKEMREKSLLVSNQLNALRRSLVK